VRSVLGRSDVRTAKFVADWSRPGKPAPRAVSDLGALLGDASIDAVYVATPHSRHAAFVRECLLAGKPVRCEKPLVPGLAAARELVALAREQRVFLMEALWTRFLPVYARVRDWLESGAIGNVQAIRSSFCFHAPYDPDSRLFSAELAGGSLLDIGNYNVAATRWVLEAALGAYPDPLSSLRMFGDRGWICIPRRFWEATEAVLSRRDQPPETVQDPFRINGFEEEIEETIRCMRAGRVESANMPRAETLAIVGCLDELQRQLKVRYPFESVSAAAQADGRSPGSV
jgi:predicted dehydrogenase